MESSATKVELIKQAIKQVMEEDGDDDHRHRLLLSNLMSQLEVGEEEEAEEEEEEEEEDQGVSKSSNEEDKIVKELKKLRRQNVITHWLLSLMIVLTVAWQISEVSIILKLKDGVTHPFRSIATIFKSIIFKDKPLQSNKDDDDDHHPQIDSKPLHDFKLPLPKIDF